MQAFKRSLKRSSKEKEKKKEDKAEEAACSDQVLLGLSKSPLTCSQAQGPPGSDRRERRSGEDDVEYEVRVVREEDDGPIFPFQDEGRLGVLKRKTGQGQDKGSSEEAEEDKMLLAASAFKNSFGRIKKNSKTSASGPARAGLS